jgi:serine/threonine protein kinase
VGFDVPCFADYVVNLSAFEEKSIICNSNKIPNQICYRIEDQFLVFMKSKPHSENVSESEIENEIENLINLRHPCIAAPIGFVFPIGSGSRRELKIVRLYLEGRSLAGVLSVNPVWWTSTVKAKVIAGIVLGLRFAHSLGLLHGHLTGNNILFDSEHCVQIVDFNPIPLEIGEGTSEDRTQFEGFSREEWARERDIQAFASILFELVFGRPLQGEAFIPTGIPDFVSRIIESGLSPISRTGYSFNTILKILKQNKFQIEDGVDSAEVSAFVSWVESAEQPDK